MHFYLLSYTRNNTSVDKVLFLREPPLQRVIVVFQSCIFLFNATVGIKEEKVMFIKAVV